MSDEQWTEQQTGPYAPDPHHLWLQRRVGVWDVECEYCMEPTAEPIRVYGTDTVEAVGPFWTVGNFEVELPGFPLTGRAAQIRGHAQLLFATPHRARSDRA